MNNQPKHDIFISYSSKDKAVADAVCHALEENGITCWIAPRDVIPGIDYEDQIPQAINCSQAIVLIFSANSNISKHVRSEVRIAFNAGKPNIPFVIDSTQMSDGLNYYLGSPHWLVAYPDYREKTRELVTSICRLLGKEHLLKEKSLLREMVNEEAVLLGKPHPFYCHADILEGHTRTIYSAAFSPNGKQIVSASEDKSIRIWDLMTGDCLWVIKDDTDSVLSASFSPDGKRIVSASRNEIRIWDTKTKECVKILKGRNHAAFSPDGKLIVAEGYAMTLFILDVETGECINMLEHKSSINNASFSPDGRKIIAVSGDNTIRIWDAQTGECIRAITENELCSASFSPDGKKIVSSSRDKTIRIWDTKTGKIIKALEGHKESVWEAFFSSDGKRIVSTSLDKTVRIWDVKTGECIHQFGNPYTPYKLIKCATLSPNGETILLVLSDNTIHISDL